MADPRNTRGCNWICTITNLEGHPDLELQPEPELYEAWRIPEDNLEHLSYWQYQPEVGDEHEEGMHGRLHVQLFIVTKQKGLRYRQCTELMGLESWQVHWEAARDPPAAARYCGKEESRLEGGTTKTGGTPPMEKRGIYLSRRIPLLVSPPLDRSHG